MSTKRRPSKAGDSAAARTPAEPASGTDEDSSLTDDVVRDLAKIDPVMSRIPLSIALVQRLRYLWDVICGNLFKARINGDELLYQEFRQALLNQTGAEPRFRTLHKLARTKVPKALPTMDELPAFDESVTMLVHRDFQELETALIQFALRRGDNPNPTVVDAALVIHDANLNAIERVAYAKYEADAAQFGLPWESPALWQNRWSQAKSSQPVPQNRGGRPKIEVPYDEAAKIYRSFLDDPDDPLHSDAPTPKEFRERYTQRTGKRLSEWVYRNRVKEWEAEGRTWPPPEPEDSFGDESG
jgi:hypothetical protein